MARPAYRLALCLPLAAPRRRARGEGEPRAAGITHATPAAGYAHSADRNFEDDTELPEGCEVPDIASQLIDAMSSDFVDIAMGGGGGIFCRAT